MQLRFCNVFPQNPAFTLWNRPAHMENCSAQTQNILSALRHTVAAIMACTSVWVLPLTLILLLYACETSALFSRSLIFLCEMTLTKLPNQSECPVWHWPIEMVTVHCVIVGMFVLLLSAEGYCLMRLSGPLSSINGAINFFIINWISQWESIHDLMRGSQLVNYT